METINKKHFLLFLSLYITQFLGLFFFSEAFIAILRKNGVSLESLGIIYMLGLLYVIRFIWSPLIDKINFVKIGHYRFWLILAQLVMLLCLFITSYLDIDSQIALIIVFAFIFSFFSATQDIALDGLVYKTLTKKQRPLGNAIKVSGNLLGALLGGGIALIIYSYIGWQKTLLILSLVTSIAIIQLIFYKEPSFEKKAKKHTPVFKEFYNFWKGKNRKIWLVFIFLFPCATSTAHGLTTPILVDSKWDLKDIGFIVHIVGYSIGIISSFGASYFIHKFGRIFILRVSIFGQIIALLLLLFMLKGYIDTLSVTIIVGIIYFFYTPSATVISTLMMDEIDSDNPASQYAIQHSIFMFSGVVFISLGIYFSGKFSYESVIIFISILAIIPLILSFLIQKYLKKQSF